MSDDTSSVLVKDNGFTGRLSFPGKILFKLLNDDQFYRDVIKSSRLSISNFPKYDQWTSKEGFHIEFALAGFSKSDISVSYSGNILYISSSSDEAAAGNATVNSGISRGVISRGIARRSFKTSFYISDDFDMVNITSFMKEGLLSINIPAADASGPINVCIK